MTARIKVAGRAVLAAAILAAAALPAGPGSAGAAEDERPELTLYAAASLRDALAALEGKASIACGHRIVFNFSASGTLARQIVAGARADVFFSADPAWVDSLVARKLIYLPSRRAVLGNELVVIVPAAAGEDTPWSSPRKLADASIRRIALAQPETVPAGRYARAWFERAGLWAAVEPKVVPALDVRAALAAVASGAVDAGVVYRTDAATSARVAAVFAVPPGEAPAIRYEAAALAAGPRLEAARRLVAWLASGEAAAVFRAHGFTTLSPEP